MKSIAHLCRLAFAVLLLMPVLAISAPTTEMDVRQAWQLLDYIAVDYSEAVQDGQIVDAGEYVEMQEFSATVRERIAGLPDTGKTAELLAAAEHIAKLIEDQVPAPEVARAAHVLADELLAAYDIVALPSEAPNVADAVPSYASQCASCHGATGAGDGELAPGMEPPPIAFTDVARADQRSPLALYEAITQGLEGTTMVSYAHLPEEERWALAFYVGTLAYGPEDRARGELAWENDPEIQQLVPSLEALTRSNQKLLAETLSDEQARVITAYLRSNPHVVVPASVDEVGALGVARRQLSASLEAYRGGDVAGAQRLVLSAYLDGVEHIEPMLAVRDRGLLREVEDAMTTLRSSIRDQAPLKEIEAQAVQANALFDRSEALLQESHASATAAFVGSLTILLREGLEALLIVIGMIAFLRHAGRQDALPWVHAGWVGALLAGAATWVAATWLINISGAQRELTEGLSSLFAALVLLSVGIWMHQKSMAGRWQEYLNRKLSVALNRRSAWFLFILAFVAVYREVFETILFYAAMWNPQDSTAILAGLVVGVVLLAGIAVALLRLGMRLPIGKFFAYSSVLIAILAVVLVGKGVVALQEAGWIGLTLVNGPRIDLFGIYPSWQSLLAQVLVAIVAIGGFMFNARGNQAAA